MTPPPSTPASAAPLASPDAPPAPTGGWEWPARRDPRWPFAAILSTYCVLGVTLLGFNRSWVQMLLVIGAGCALDALLCRVARGRKVVPLSAYISCCSLALLLNYSHGSPWLFVPVLLTIGSKYVLTAGGRHVFNPSMFGVAVSLLATGELVTAAPAYQWAGGSWAMSSFIVMAGLALFVFRIGRGWLIGSFLVLYALQTALRAWVMRHHLPPEMLFLGTLGAPPFFIFTFYMLTDPATSPATPKKQVLLALAITLVDLWLHTKESVFTFFYAALFCAGVRFTYLQVSALRPGVLLGLALAVWGAVRGTTPSAPAGWDPGFRLQRLAPERTGIHVEMGDLLERVDPRVAHVAKWVLSVGDAVATADVDLDGRQDLFFTDVLKRDQDRCALYLNRGGLRFERAPLPEVARHQTDFKTHGAPAGATFCDWDGDGDPDLALAMGFGRARFLRNRRVEDGALSFEDVTDALGIDEHTVSLAITFLDLDRDARLDALVTNSLLTHLPGYDAPTPLNIFDLPPPAYEGDRRMLRFMHDGWHDADNGGPNLLYRQGPDGRFTRLAAEAVGLTETRWSLAVATADLNRDGWTDLYIANDFGPDELYLNHEGKTFESIKGELFADVGRDTYKGMNASVADFDRNGWLDVYVSNVHHALQAEGSLLWMTRPTADPFRPSFTDEATARGALNERRFGWGGAAGDLDLDGWADLVQANGMVDDRLDRRFEAPSGALSWLFRDHRDYWYVNHKLMQSGPELHTYADMWGDIRGRTIYPNEARRVYVNRGAHGEPRFVDVAARVGAADPDNSRGVALVDLDDDGDLDVVITNQHGPPSLYENTLRAPGRTDGPGFLGLCLVGNGVTTHREAIGTQVVVRTKDGEQVAERGLLGGFSGQGDPRLLFGLGDHQGPVEVIVRWYGGEEQRLVLEPDRYHELRQPPPHRP